ncbi:MALSU1 family protein [Megaselia abdita]
MFASHLRLISLRACLQSWRRPSAQAVRHFHPEFTNNQLKATEKEYESPAGLKSKYDLFKDEDSQEIFDVEEEKLKYMEQESVEVPDTRYQGLNLDHGVSGVFDIKDLVHVLHKENAKDIFVCRVPKEYKYVDYMVIVTGRSYRHMLAISTFVRKLFKIKRVSGEIIPKIEGEKSREWMALDLGNIALHVFSEDARLEYNLESLWAIGREFDTESNQPKDALVELYEKHSLYLHDLNPKI